MFRTSARLLHWMALGLMVCLMAPGCRTSRTAEQAAGECPAPSAAADNTIRKLNEIIIPEMTFFAPATIIDAVDFLTKASREYDKSGAPLEMRGLSFVLYLPPDSRECGKEVVDPFAEGASTNRASPLLPAISVRTVSLMDALRLVCDVTDMKIRISQEGTVRIKPKWRDLDEDWCTRLYAIPEALSARLFGPSNGSGPDANPNKVWQAFFEELGVTGPECARFEYLPVINKLRVTNTPENLAIIEQVFDAFALRMVEMEMQIQAFRVADIERLRLSDGVSVETLAALRLKGRSKPVATATALAKSGQEVAVKAVREVLYPTELLTDSEQTGSNLISRSAAKALMPGSFEVRETGMILQVIPEVETGGSEISLILNPSWVALDGWETYPAGLAAGWTHKTLPFKQPVFGVTSFQTQLEVSDGGTVLLGSCSTPDGEWVQVGFLTARLQGVQKGRPSGAHGKKSRAERESGFPDDSLVKRKMRDIVIPEMTFRPPATIIDALKFFKEASAMYDRQEVPQARGVSFVLKLAPTNGVERTEVVDPVDPFAAAASPVFKDGAPVISALSARFIDLYDALKLVCDVTGMRFRIRDGIVWIEPVDDPDGDLVTRTYLVLPSLSERCSAQAGEMAALGNSAVKSEVKFFFAKMGVSWPEGSSITYSRLLGRLRVTNTPENLAVFEQVFVDLQIPTPMVETEVQIHAFRSEDVERLRLSGDVSVESLRALRKEGRSRPVASATVLTKTGQEGVMKSVREVLYPTETGAGEGPGAFRPCQFEMREVGMLLQVVPEVNTEDPSLINLILNPQWVTLDRWISYPADLAAGWTHKTLPFRQPVFGATSWQTQVMVKDGGTVLLGSNTTPDGKWVQVGFLTARRVNVQSEASGNSP